MTAPAAQAASLRRPAGTNITPPGLATLGSRSVERGSRARGGGAAASTPQRHCWSSTTVAPPSSRPSTSTNNIGALPTRNRLTAIDGAEHMCVTEKEC